MLKCRTVVTFLLSDLENRFLGAGLFQDGFFVRMALGYRNVELSSLFQF